ncbi:MAG: DNA gyrase/topoisomerase IV subunit A [Rikenellaceae bacterium]
MRDDIDNIDDELDGSAQSDDQESTECTEPNLHKFSRITEDTADKRQKLTGMYREWFLDYASYVILERAVPHLHDGFKPVQRRILHSMKRMDDGRYNKVANIIGNTMQYHPHGDRSIGDALVQMGQKDLLVDCQGNWGNILTGDSSAAPRYIEARLSKFALDVVYNPKTTEWMLTYDGRNREPVTLPVKFPLLLAQGVEGIAVGLASKILPHNFIELIDASISYLKGESFELYPDFPTGGMVDVSRYNDGLRGGSVKIRAKIVKIDKNTLAITEIPFGKTTTSIIESVIKANDKNKIKIKRIDDNTAENVEILIQIGNDVSADKCIDALYAFTDCEVSISPNSCVILDDKPHFMAVSSMLSESAERTKMLLGSELEIRLHELGEDWHISSLERLFIEKRIYRTIEECESWQEVLDVIDKGLEPYKKMFQREITIEDITKLTEIKIKRISKYDGFKADEHIKAVEDEIKVVQNNLDHLNDYTIAHYQRIKKDYSKGRERRTELRNFSNIEATQVAVANAKLYVNRDEGFFGIGAGMKKDEFVCDCSDIDDVIIFTEDGQYVITKVSEKAYFQKKILHIGIFKRNDERTIYNVIYQDGASGAVMIKRCAIKGVTRDKVYDITKGTPKSKILYLSVNPNGEAEVLKVYFKPRPRLKKLIVDIDFSEQMIKGRSSQGNTFTRNPIHKITLKSKGISTLTGQNIWFDSDINRLNKDEIGELVGMFTADDKIVVFTTDGGYYTTGYDVNQYFPENFMSLEKYNPNAIYSVTYYDAEAEFFYVKRFAIELSDGKAQLFIPESKGSYLVSINSDSYPRLEVKFTGANSTRSDEIVDVEQFIGVKSFRAKGKRVSTYAIGSLVFIEPERFDDDSQQSQEEEVEDVLIEADVEVINDGDDSPTLFDDF